jgi:hypothetical protein
MSSGSLDGWPADRAVLSIAAYPQLQARTLLHLHRIIFRKQSYPVAV